MAAIGTWVQNTYRTYIGNAGATRDYRVQLRGNRSMILFGVYLVLLIGVALYTYDRAVGNNGSIIEVQRQLKDFYMVILVTLGTMISLVTPALSATTVVSERQRRSLDLVFSAPVTPKYYLVGKMVAVYRYAWMLLALSLPVTATCVVLGGASWSDVLTAYGLLSMHALALGSIALLVSSITAKPVAAIIWSYGACALYLGVTAGFGASAMASGFYLGSTSGEVSFMVAMNPFLAEYAGGTYTMLLGHQIPNWILAFGATLLITKFMVHTAGAVMAPTGSRDVPSLRVYGLLYAWVCAAAIGATLAPRTFGTDSNYLGAAVFYMSIPLIFALPTLSCFGLDGSHRFEPNGLFSFRKMFDGTPAGGLPYILTFLVGTSIAYLVGYQVMGSHGATMTSYMVYGSGAGRVMVPTSGMLVQSFLAVAYFTVAFWVMFWAVGRLASSFLNGLRTARMVPFVVMVALCAVPAPFLSAIDSMSFSSDEPSLWYFYLLRPVVHVDAPSIPLAVIDGTIMLIAAAVLVAASQTILKRRLKEIKSNDRDLATAQAI